MTRDDRLFITLGLFAILAWFGLEHPAFFSNINRCIPIGLFTGKDSIATSYEGSDAVQVFYLFWKLHQTLATGANVFSDPYNFAAANHLFFDISIGAQYWVAALLLTFFSAPAAYNLGVILIPTALLFLASFYLLAQVTPSAFLRFCGALALTLVPYRLTQAAVGHGGAAVLFLTPLYWGAVLDHQSRGGRLAWPGVLAGVSLFVCMISEEHLGFYLLIGSGLVFPIWCVQAVLQDRRRQTVWNFIGRWRFLLVGLLAVVLYGVVLNHVVLGGQESGEKFKRSLSEIGTYSLPLPQLLFGQGAVGGVILCALLPIVAAAALVIPRPFVSLLRSRLFPMALALPILVALTTGIGDHWSQRTGIYQLFYDHLPFFSYQRVPIKMFGMLTTFSTLLFFAATNTLASAARTLPTPQRHFAAGFAIVAAAAGAYQSLEHVRLLHKHSSGLRLENMNSGPTHFFDEVRSRVHPEDIILPVPVTDRMGGYATWGQFLAWKTGRRIGSGYNGAAPVYYLEALPFLTSYNSAEPSRSAALSVQQLGYTYVIVDGHYAPEDAVPDLTDRLRRSVRHLEQIFCEDYLCLFRIRRDLLEQDLPSDGWTGPTTKLGVPGRWMLQEPTRSRQDFAVISKVDLPESTHQVEIEFAPLLPIPLWVVEPNQEPREIPESAWQGAGTDRRRAVFSVSSGSFSLGCRDVFEPRKYGVPTDYAKYCHFVYFIKPL